MTDLIFERDYAREMLFAAIQRQAREGHVSDSQRSAGQHNEDIATLVAQAVEMGCCRTELIVELANLGARLFACSAPDSRPALAREMVEHMDHIAC